MHDIQNTALDAGALCDIFPFHIAVDSGHRIVQFGRSIHKLTPDMSVGDPLLDHWKVLRASLGDDWGSLVDSAGSLVVLESNATQIRLKGQVVLVDSGNIVMFLATPVLSSIEMMTKSGLELQNFAAHDVIVDFLFALQVRDRTLTEIHDAHRTLSERSRSLVDYRDMIERHVGWIVLDEEGVIRESNVAFSGIVHIDGSELVGKKVNSLLCDEDELFKLGFQEVLATNDAWQGELQFRRGDGGVAWCFSTISTWKSTREGHKRFSLIFTDITSRKEIEQRQATMMRELDHRVKNSLATVMSLCQATARGVNTLDDYVEQFSSRISAMAKTHEVLAAGHWRETSLEQLIKVSVESMAESQGATLVVKGDQCLVGSQCATSITLFLHELATNAVKYGCFSIPGGRLEIEWSIDGNDIRIQWTESGGPPITESGTPGVGLSIVMGLIQHELGGEIEFQFNPGGLVIKVRLSQNRLL